MEPPVGLASNLVKLSKVPGSLARVCIYGRLEDQAAKKLSALALNKPNEFPCLAEKDRPTTGRLTDSSNKRLGGNLILMVVKA